MTFVNSSKKWNPFKGKNSLSTILNASLLDILEGLDTPKSLAIAIFLRYKQDPLEVLGVNPLHYNTASAYRLDTQAIALVKKSVYLEYQGDIVSEAEQHFIKVDSEIPTRLEDLPISEDAGFVYECRRLISSILGEVPSYETLEVSLTSGTNAGFNTSESTIADKLSRSMNVSPTAVLPLVSLMEVNPALKRVAMTHGIRICKSDSDVDGDIQQFGVAPKQYNKGRGMVKTHFGDMVVQRSFGIYMRLRLLKVGIDIKRGQGIHRFILQNFWESWATIDLSDASDRISTVLCKLLLPLDWFLLLKSCKNDFVKVGDQTIHMKKFMCQGNGFTFELETLLFYCIAMTAMRRNGEKPVAFVYGDDTLVPVASGSTVMNAFERCGLVVNRTKSFVSGPFRESCGCDTFNGIEVRAHYLKDLGHERTFAYIKLANIIFRIARDNHGSLVFNKFLLRAHNRILGLFKDKYRFTVPESAGDVAFISEYPDRFWENGISYFKYYRTVFDRRDYVLPVNEEASELAYILSEQSSSGNLIRFSRYYARPQRLYGF